jgi:hypothetical protein
MLSEPGPDRKLQPAERRRRSDIFDRGSRDRQNHHASEHHAGERGCEAEYEKLAEGEFHDRAKIEVGQRNVCRDQSPAHLLPALRHKKFAAPREKEQQANRQPCEKNREPFPGVQLTYKCPDR